MANVTINDLTPKASPVDGDQFELDDGAGGSFKTTKAQLLADIQAEVDVNTGKVSASGSVTTHNDVTSAGSGQIITSAERTKLNGIEAGATGDQTPAEIKTAYESNANTNAFTDADESTLDGIEPNATADQTPSEIKTAYESNANTNAYTDAEKAKLAGVEDGATGDQSPAEIKTAYESNADTNPFTDAEQAAVAANSAKVSADGSIDTHSDVDTSTAAPTINQVLAWDGSNWVPDDAPGGSAGTYNATTKDGTPISSSRATLEFRDTGDATVSVTDDPGNDRTIIEINATAGGGGGGTAKGTPFVVGDLVQVQSDLGDGTVQTAGVAVSDLATAAQGALADSAVQPGDNVSDLTNDAGYTTNVGDVVGPASAVDSNFAAFDTTTGKLVKDAGVSTASFATAAQGALADSAVQPGDNVSDLTNDAGYTSNAGDVVGPASAVNDQIAVYDGATGKLIKDGGVAVSGLATAAQGALADSATQPGDNVSTLTNDAGYKAYYSGAALPDPAGYSEGDLFMVTA